MTHFNQINGGVLPPKKKKFSKKKAAFVIVIVMVIVTASALYFSSAADGFAKQGMAFAVESWHQVFDFGGNAARSVMVDLQSSGATQEVGVENGTDTVDLSDAANTPNASNPTYASYPPKQPATTRAGRANVAAAGSGEAVPDVSDGNDEVSGMISASGSDEGAAIGLGDVLATSSSDFSGFSGQSTGDSSDAGAATSSVEQNEPSASCAFSTSTVFTATGLSRQIILNEIAWMGSVAEPGETAAKASNREWMELKNISVGAISLGGWQILDSAGNIKITFGSGDQIPAGAFYLLSRDGGMVRDIETDKAYSGALANSGDAIAIFGPGCGLSDLVDARGGWPGGNNATKQTLERGADGISWQTSLLAGGTPRAENSAGAPPATTSSTPAQEYPVSVTVGGDGPGKVVGKPAGITCPTTCTFAYASGTLLMLTETPGKDATFGGWSGACSGTADCSFIVGGMIDVAADFRTTLTAVVSDVTTTENSELNVALSPASSTAPDAPSGSVSSTDTATSTQPDAGSPPPPAPPAVASHVLVAQIQIAGASSSNDFVKLYNPTAAPVDVSGWKLHKKSSTGTDYSLRDFPQGSAVAAGGYFTWANSSGGFAQSVDADVSSAETLSADNSVALFDANDAAVDAVAWGTGANQYGEGMPYPTDPVAGQILARKSVGGAIVDTGNNAEDFVLQ